jgi:lipid-binding SYLF domain-containing protein
LTKGSASAYYKTTGASIGLQAFVFGQKGLMAGLGIQGNTITPITPK